MEAELVRVRAPNGEDGPFMPAFLRWTLGIVIAAMLIVVPAVHFRWVHTHSKRLREVTPGHFYRSGEMTAAGVIQAVHRYRIGTLLNLQAQYPDPYHPWGCLRRGRI